MKTRGLILTIMTSLLTLQRSASSEDTIVTGSLPHSTPGEDGAAASQMPKRVVELTTLDFDLSIRDGNVWLVEFYASWCGHCKTFAPAYEQLAAAVHKPGSTTRVARIDGDKERAISSRFALEGFPSFFLIDGWNVYEYRGARKPSQMLTFVEGGYKSAEPLPFWTSPMGPVGQVQAFLVVVGSRVIQFFQWMINELGLSPTVAGLLFAGTFMITGVVILIFIAVMVTPKVKED